MSPARDEIVTGVVLEFRKLPFSLVSARGPTQRKSVYSVSPSDRSSSVCSNTFFSCLSLEAVLTMADVEKLIKQAKLAEQAERYEDMARVRLE